MKMHEEVKSLYDEDGMENDKGGELNIPSKTHGLKF